jgi:hypothetical protein
MYGSFFEIGAILKNLVVFRALFASKDSSNDSGATLHSVKPFSMVQSKNKIKKPV